MGERSRGKMKSGTSGGMARGRALITSLYKHYSVTLCLLIMYVPILVYPTFINWANPAPSKDKLQWVSGRIVFAQQKHPNIRMSLPNGLTKDLDFYADLTSITRGLPNFYGATKEELSKLTGCQAEIGVVPIRWLVFPHNDRIWEVRCESFSLSYSQLEIKYQRGLKSDFWLSFALHAFITVFIIFIFIAERKRNEQ